ncbi:MAG: insulinase family protein [Deltaproteobacteria bacterium]|nr:insulinase family protein [Deltaproteobacteria bacterium]MBN2670768.1 insulinase family protein [Deltaproteobacteria bacterium]
MKRFFLFCTLTFIWMSCSSASPRPASSKPAVQTSAPETASVPKRDTAAWRNNPPQAGPAPEVVIPHFQQASLKNGLTVMVVERGTLPLVSMSLVFKSGSAVEKTTKEQGLADFTYELMMEGAGKKDGVALAAAFADLGTQMNVRTSEDSAAFKTLLLKKNIDAGAQLLAEVISKPTFAKPDFERKQKERIANLQSLMGNPNYLGSISIAGQVYGDAHPYGHPVMGTPKTVEQFTLKQVKAFYKANVQPQNAAFIVAGDITLEDAVALANQHFGTWQRRGSQRNRNAEPAEPSNNNPPNFSIVMVPKPGMNQTIISVGQRAFPVGHADEWALRIAIDAFGGMFGSRLNMNLREDKGYTYGARGQLDAMLQDGAAMFSTSVQADVTGAALMEVIQEFDKLNSRPLADAEFTAAKENVLKSVSGWFESVSGLGNAAQSIFARQLPLTRYADMVTAYEQLTLERVQSAAAYLNRDSLQVVLVGDPEVIKEQLKSVSLAEPKVLTDR